MVQSAKKQAKTLFVSATPAEFEISHSARVIEQIIRPTGLLDPLTYVYPKSGDYDALITSIDALVKKQGHMKDLL